MLGLRLIFAAIIALACSGAAEARELVFGVVSDDIAAARAKLAPVADYLGAALEPEGVDAVSIVVFARTDQMAAAMRDGRADLFADSPFGALYVAKHGDGLAFMRRWKRGVASYNGVFATRTETTIQTVNDLADALVAFEDRASTSGFLLPRSLLDEAGVPIEIVANNRLLGAAGSATGVFSRSDDTSMVWLLAGRVDAAAVDPQTFARFDAAHPGALRTFAQTQEVPRQVLVHSKRLEAPIVEALTQALIAMHATPDGAAALKVWDETARLDPLDQSARDGLRLVAKQLSAVENEFAAR